MITRFNKRDIQGYRKVCQALKDAKDYADNVMREGSTEVLEGLAITKGSASSQRRWDMDKIESEFGINKDKYGISTPTKARVTVNIIDK